MPDKTNPKARLRPTAETEAERALRQKLRTKARSPLQRWMRLVWPWMAGWCALAALGCIAVGVAPAYELMAGLTSPVGNDEMLPTISSWFFSVSGWLLIPTMVGAVVGYVVSTRVSSFRSKSMETVLALRELDTPDG